MTEDLVYSTEFRCWYRPNTTDLSNMQMVRSYSKISLESSDIVLDLGAHIGSYSRFALDHGCKVGSVECYRPNFDILLQNVPEAICHLAAVRSNVGAGQIQSIYKGKRTSPASISIFPGKGKVVVDTVPAMSFAGLLDTYKSTVVKMDIEGTEYELLADQLPEHVRALIVEFHPSKPGAVATTALYRGLQEQFSTTLRIPSFASTWPTIGMWLR